MHILATSPSWTTLLYKTSTTHGRPALDPRSWILACVVALLWQDPRQQRLPHPHNKGQHSLPLLESCFINGCDTTLVVLGGAVM